jgi:hypothetical protein
MGRNIRNLSETSLQSKTIFPKRMITECDETMHLHWRNLRLEMSDDDFVEFANMIIKAYSAKMMKNLKTQEGQHMELAIGEIKNPIKPDSLKVDEQVNLYKILNYPHAEFYEEDEFIVIRLRDLRIEMGKEEFKTFAGAIKEADEKLN